MPSTCCSAPTSRTWRCCGGIWKSAADLAATASSRAKRCGSTETAGLPQGFAKHHRRGHRDIERASLRAQRNAQADIGGGMHAGRHPGTLATQQQRILGLELEVRISQVRPRRQQHETGAAAATRALKSGKVQVPDELDVRKIIEAGAAQRPVGQGKAGWADDLDGRAQAGRQAQDRARILWNVRLVKGKAHGSAPGCGGGLELGAAICAKLPPPRPSDSLVPPREECKKNARQNVQLGATRRSPKLCRGLNWRTELSGLACRDLPDLEAADCQAALEAAGVLSRDGNPASVAPWRCRGGGWMAA